ncbi:MAG: sulfatase-like hydrolase/transferase [Alphaproteobacteria bacterium]|nr:sulfatase-like hydrolase/transferase [Alphaproteobacteria bacterium]
MATRKQPNILFIMSDDHAAKAIGCYGHGINSTPGLDRIAREGVRLNHCYVSNSICTPSRAAILTGTYNHVNGVMTLDDKIDNRLPNVAKHLRAGGYQTAMFGKWHMGEGKAHEPTGFDAWAVVPGQGDYFDPLFHEPAGPVVHKGYVTDVITDMCVDWLDARDRSRPFFLMCHHKAPHRSWEAHPKNRGLYTADVRLPDTFDDDYKNRARAAREAKMRIADDMTYLDLGLVQPEGGAEIGEPLLPGMNVRKLPKLSKLPGGFLIDKDTGERFAFASEAEYDRFKYQRYIKRYLRTVASIDESVGRLLDFLDKDGAARDTLVIYTSDQGFFLGEHGWYDKRFMYEESFQMPFLARFPAEIPPGGVVDAIASNVDFAPTFLDVAGLPVPSYMQGRSMRAVLKGQTPAGWPEIAYHRYWMHRDEYHNAYAHYGIRDRRYKLIYWYNQGFGLAGTQAGGEPPEWEFFDCEADPLELFNVHADPKYATEVARMTRLLETKMAEIGDEPAHAGARK